MGGRYHGRDMDAPAERMGFGYTLSWLGRGCSGRTDGVCGNVINHGWDMDILWDRMEFVERYHGWDMDAVWERMEFV